MNLHIEGVVPVKVDAEDMLIALRGKFVGIYYIEDDVVYQNTYYDHEEKHWDQSEEFKDIIRAFDLLGKLVKKENRHA